LSTEAGPILLDWDAVSSGDIPWDLIHTHHGQHRFGVTAAEVDEFVAVYGFDLRDWDGYDVLMKIRDLYCIGIHVRNAPGDPFSRRELRYRLGSLLEGDRERGWNMRP
jgi:hypothetical protein